MQGRRVSGVQGQVHSLGALVGVVPVVVAVVICALLVWLEREWSV